VQFSGSGFLKRDSLLSHKVAAVERDLRVRIRKKYGLCPKQVSCFLSGYALHFAVLLNGDIFRSSLFSKRGI
jgi:hypothetical protein